MSAATKIEWTDRTWNPVRGCSIVSPGCVNCYAMKFAHRFSGEGQPYEGLTKLSAAGPTWSGKVRLVPEVLEEPLRWRKPQRIFVNSMSDLFHEDVNFHSIAQVFFAMGRARQHTFQVLTKRPQRMVEFFKSASARIWATADLDGAPLPNVWLGVSVEDQKRADERIPLLLQVPAAVRFLSCEPLLGPVDLARVVLEPSDAPERGKPPVSIDALRGWHGGADKDRTRLGWVIVGGESGPGARPMRLAWAQRIADDCRSAGVPVFVKQLGALPHSEHTAMGEHELVTLKLRDRKGGDMDEWPEALRVREFPEVRP